MKALKPKIFHIILLISVYWSVQTTTINNNDLDNTDSPIVSLSLGKIQGKVLKTLYGKDIYAYRGIRYAQAPVNELRFKAPVPEKAWLDTFKALEDSLVCPQAVVSEDLISEDCLKLNVFTKNLTARVPVMVYIHGGAHVLGSGHSIYEAGPQYLLDHNVVLVAFNYRLGALGFASTKTSEYPGNYGFLDQVLALKWVQKHIAQFGGDPDNVTIFGMSAGSMAVSLHLVFPLSKGLFHKAIAMSGSATNHFHIDNLQWTRKIAREVGCPQYNSSDMMQCLRGISWQKLVKYCNDWSPYGFMNMKWNYEIDGIFLKEHPSELFSKGEFSRVPLIVGFTVNEFDFSAYHQENNSLLLNDIGENFDLYAPELFLYQEEQNSQFPLKSDFIKEFYFKDITHINSTYLIKLGKIFSDSILGHGIHRLVHLASKYQPVYYYRMDYLGRRSLQMDPYGKPRGVVHIDDLQYVMPSLWYGSQFSKDDPEIMMVNRLTNLWTSFAKNGIPVSFDMIDWKPFNHTHKLVLYNNITAYMGPQAFTDRYQLWDDLFPIDKSSSPYIIPTLFSIIITIATVFVVLKAIK